MIIGNKHSMQEALESKISKQLSEGLQLARNSDRVLYESRFDPDVKITMGDLMESDGPSLDNDWVRAGTAMMLENVREYFDSLNETTKLVHIGDFQKYAFNMVRALFPSLAAHEWASVQPMDGPYSTVFFMKFIYGSTKGSALAGQDVIENPNQDYASEHVDAESVGTGTGAAVNFTGNLSYLPAKPGTISITDGTQIITDDGNGNLVGDTGAGTNTINYQTGAFDLDFDTAPGLGDPLTAEYDYDGEANDTQPDMDMVLTSSPVQSKPRRLRTRWSVESQQDLKRVWGLDAELEQVSAATSEMKYEIDSEVGRDIKTIASNSVTAFSKTPPSGISYTEHKLLFVDKLLEASGTIFSSTQRGVGTFIHAGTNVATLIQSLPGFQGLPKPPNTRGVYKSGTLNGDFEVWKDPTYPGATRNTSDDNGYTMGYKGTSMWEIGYILAPYIMAYMTPTTELDDFQNRKGIMSRYGKKAIEGRFFCTGTITGTPF